MAPPPPLAVRRSQPGLRPPIVRGWRRRETLHQCHGVGAGPFAVLPQQGPAGHQSAFRSGREHCGLGSGSTLGDPLRLARTEDTMHERWRIGRATRRDCGLWQCGKTENDDYKVWGFL